ncbi:MAG TPA: sodium:proton antiporter, partial [Acidobacteria bacterium]|nr:sodium:proton antiporter [Acidobacteriota bacterium]
MVMTTIVAAVALGILAQLAAERLRLPAILPLLVLGMALGPHGAGLFDPASLGDVLEVFIHLGVAIILFEGGLTLDFSHLVREREPVRNLLTIGVLVTGAGGAWAAHGLAGMPWPAATLFGAIMTVTGPTVIVPLLRHMIVPRRIKTILVSEGLIIDPVGAVLAYLVLQWIQRSGVPLGEMGAEVVLLVLTGTILGFAGGALAKFFLRTRFVSGELRNLVVLAILMLTYLGADRQASQSGILAAVVMGITVAADELPDLVSLRAFKGQVTALVISVLFILLAGELDLASIWSLGVGGWLVVAVLILVVRPLAVVLSVWPSMAPWRERLVLAMTAPRGIVAAAIASLAARDLVARGIAGAHALEGLVYLSILVTGAWATAGAVVLPRLLGFLSDPSRRRAVLVGENALTTVVGHILRRLEWAVVVIDTVPWRLERARGEGLKPAPDMLLECCRAMGIDHSEVVM